MQNVDNVKLCDRIVNNLKVGCYNMISKVLLHFNYLNNLKGELVFK